MSRANPLKRFFFPYRYDVSVFSPISGKEDHFYPSSLRAWFADPFLFSQEEDDYQVFVELMATNHKKGEIAVFTRGSSKYEVVLSEPFHLSFPNVFVLDDQIYMMPESSAIEEIRLYKCAHYPDDFTYFKTLLKGEKFVDSVIFVHKGNYFLGTYSQSVSPNQLQIYRFDATSLEAGERLCCLDDPKKIFRPAGNPFVENGITVFPMQIGTSSYGENVAFYSFDIIDGQIALTPLARNIPLPDRRTKYCHMHTYNLCGDFACVDFAKNHFSLLQGLYGIPASFRLRRRKK